MSYRVFFFATPLARVRVVPLFTAALAALAAVGLSAQDTPDSLSLSAWHVSGPAPSIGADRILTLPAGAELVRSVAAGQVAVRLVSRPYFSPQPTGWPALEVGPASLTFVRNQAGGGMVLLGDQPLSLPFVIALSGDGRSQLALDFTLTYDQPQNAASLVVNGQAFRLSASGPPGPVEVVLSAGTVASWPIETLSVQSTPDNQAPDAGAKGGKSAGTNASNRIDQVSRTIDPAAFAAESKKAFEDATALFKARDFVRAEEALGKGNRHQPGTYGWQLESAGKLTQVALSLRQKYDYPGAMAVARRALLVLQEAEKLARGTDPQQLAGAHEMAALLQDELLRDPSAARAEYQKAQLANPQSTRTREGLKRLDEAQAKTQRLAGGR